MEKVNKMKTIEIKLYEYDELDDKAKQRARDWFREGSEFDFDFVKAEFNTFLESIGFENVSSQFSGFYSQGDGASFDFKGVDFEKLFNPQGCDIKEYKFIHDKWLAARAGLIRTAKRIAKSLHAESGRTSNANRYSHARTRYACLELDHNTDACLSDLKIVYALREDIEEALTYLMRELSDAYYNHLGNEYDYQNEDDTVADNIKANEYTFLQDGKRFG